MQSCEDYLSCPGNKDNHMPGPYDSIRPDFMQSTWSLDSGFYAGGERLGASSMQSDVIDSQVLQAVP